MANLQKLIDLDGLSYFLGQIKAKFVRSVNGAKPDSKGNVNIADMEGATFYTAGKAGLVPIPAAGKQDMALCGDATYKVLPLAGGGTGASDASGARTNLGLKTAITGASIRGTNITLTKADGENITLTTQDTNTVTNVSITAGTVAHGGTIPLPSGYTRAQCKYAVWPISWTESVDGIDSYNLSVNQSTGVVTCNHNGGSNRTAGYLCVGVK